MSDRLRYSTSAMVRAMQMSSHPITIWVEGKNVDPSFVDFLVSASSNPLRRTWCIRRGYELADDMGGKNVLLGFHKILKRRKLLHSELSGNRTAVVFFLDKDADDLKRNGLVECSHVVYTKNYNAEVDVVLNADFERAVSSSASIEMAKVRQIFGDYSMWIRNLHFSHKTWISICLFCFSRNLGKYGFRRIPPGNFDRSSGLEDSSLTAAIIEDMEIMSRLTPGGFARSYRKIEKFVEMSLRNESLGGYFNGKWYIYWMAACIRRGLAPAEFDGAALENKLESALLCSLDFRASWAAFYRQRFEVFLQAN